MGNLTFNIGVNSDDFIMKAEQMRFSIHALALESKKANNANSDFANILKKTLDIIGGTETLKDFASDVVRVRGEFEQLEISFATLLKNREKANVLMSQIIKTAAETPFNLKELAIGAKLLIEYGAEFEQVNDTLIRLGNIASGMGLPLEQLIELYGNVMEQGKLYEQNIDQFTIFGIPMLQGLADMLGVTTAKITELVSVGKIGFPEVQKVIGNLTNEGGQFYGLMDEQSRTISGKIENIRDAWESMLNEVGQSQEGIINESLNGTQYILDNYEQLGKAVSELVIVYGSYKAILITITALQRLNLIVMEQANLEMLLAAKAGMVVSQSQALAAAKTKLFTGAIKANTIALLQNPYTFIAAAVVGLGYAIYKVTTAETELEKAHSRLNEANMNVEKSLTSEVSKLSSLERKFLEMLLAAKAGMVVSQSQALAAAKTKLFTGAIKANTIALLQNPYTFIAAAVVGLGYAIYKVTTAETELEKAHSRLNEANMNVEKSLTSEVSKLSSLERKLIEVKKGSEEYNKIKKTIVDNYGQYYIGLDEEIDRVGNLSTSYAQLVENMRLSIGQRKFEFFFNTEQENLDKTISEKLDVAYDTLIKKFGQTRGGNLYNQFFDSAMSGKALSPNVIKDLKSATFWDMKWGDNAEDGLVDFRNNVFNLRSEISKETKATETVLEEYKSKFRITDEEVAGILFDNAEKTDNGEIKGLKTLKKLVSEIEKVKENINNQRKKAQDGLADDSELQKANETLNKLKELYKLRTGADYDKQASFSGDNKQKQEDLHNRQDLEGSNLIEDLENKSAQAEIDAMEEGEEKKLAQMELNHQKEIAELKRLKTDYLQKKIDLEKTIFEANSKNEGKTFDESTVSLNENEKSAFANILKQTVARQGNDISVYYKEILSKYQGYTEKRLAVQQKFEQEREALRKAGASKETLAEHDYQKEGALEAVDSEFAMREDSFQSWTNSIANMSLEQLQKLLFQAEQELQRSEFLSPNDPKLAGQRAKVSSLKNEISEKTNETQTAPEKRGIKEWQELYKTLGNVESGFNEIGDAVGGTAGEIISAAGGIASSTLQMIDGIVMLANGSSTAMSGTAQAASTSIQTVEKASVILAIIGAALQVATKIADMFGADYSDYDTAKENYESYVKVLDVIIGKQKELLETLTGKAAVEASQKAIELIEKQADAARTLGKERLNAGASAGSHSIGVRMRKGMNNEGWAEWNNFANSIGMNPDDIGNRMTGLFDLTAEQLATLQRDAPTFWAKLDGDVREYLEQIIACNEETEEMRDLLNESLTQVSFDDVFSSFLDALSDMDSSSEEFANNFEKYMQKAILNSMLIDNYKSRINEWYKAFAKANESGGIDEKEYADLQESWNGIVSDALEERNALMQQFGWSSGEESSSQSSTQKGFAAMSQDTGDELNGRFTALQISNEEIKNSMLFVLGSLSSLCTTASDSNLLLTDMRNLAVMSNGHLEDIAKYTKVLLGFGEKLDNIDRNTKNI